MRVECTRACPAVSSWEAASRHLPLERPTGVSFFSDARAPVHEGGAQAGAARVNMNCKT